MAVVTLTTDWGNTDFHVAAMKGEILGGIPDARIIDISHDVDPYDIYQTKWILGNSWYHYPKGTVHIIGVRGQSGIQQPLKEEERGYAIAAKFRDHYFIGCNDGMMSILFGTEPEEVYYILTSKGEKVMPDYEVLASAAVFLMSGGKISNVGKPVGDLITKKVTEPFRDNNSISGHVVFVDRFGNLVTNVTKEIFEDIVRDSQFEILVRSREYTIYQISDSYDRVVAGELVALFNSAGHLEIALRENDASKLIGSRIGDTIRIEIK